ncbi:unnamed protein product [Oikopleura dioica]|uniref:Uncharacterized protein n=1 Tax=Oikopleura dioica TaxID=34765 RepID=E4WS57_OIKDI|nr:unnamed protein product [Oikopleura dioica]
MNRLINYRSLTSCKIADSIEKVTEKTRDHLTPELKLALVTPKTPAYTLSQEQFPFKDPYWYVELCSLPNFHHVSFVHDKA